MRAVHVVAREGLSPLMRGNPAPSVSGNALQGSIPTHAGKPADAEILAHQLGSIPTHAGKPISNASVNSMDEVYPHSCGETLTLRFQRHIIKGLSPLMRGNRPADRRIGHADGSIPTHAGKPLGARDDRPRQQVYPHSCGETADVPIPLWGFFGLSPLMRGNR